jgi:hypothetical protein
VSTRRCPNRTCSPVSHLATDPFARRPFVIAGLAAFAATLVIAIVSIRPERIFPVGFDTASTVVYFQRLVAGERLEAFLGTTPKPLLTVVDGLLFAVFHDWRAIGIVAAVVFALGVGLATVLAGRVSGSLPGAAFVGAALAASWLLLQDAGFAYAYGWMVVTVAAAGLAITRRDPRYVAAGVALFAGTLARPEVLFVTALGAIAYTGAVLRARATGGAVSSGWLQTLTIALLALPIQGLHDWLLTGDPVYTLQVQAIGAAGRIDVHGLSGAIDLVTEHYKPLRVLIAIAVAGLVAAALRRQWPIVIALLALGPATVAFVLAVGSRNLIVLERYLTPTDVAIVFAAGIAVGVTWTWLRDTITRRGQLRSGRVTSLASAGAVTLAVVAALVLSRRVGPWDVPLRTQLARESRAATDLAALVPAIRREVDRGPGSRALPPARRPFAYAWTGDLARVALLMPARFFPTIIAELGLAADRVATLGDPRFGTDGSYPRPGWLVVHIKAVPDPDRRYTFLDVDGPTTVGRIRLVPIATVDRDAWLFRIEAAP